jgi:pimeloyl-ACP methyl ester carboxylesterase
MHLALLHGWGATGGVWQRQVRVFAETCTVHAPDIPRWEVAWVAAYLTHLPLAHTVLVGWSLGGMLLLEALAETQAQPAGLVLVGVPAVFCRREGRFRDEVTDLFRPDMDAAELAAGLDYLLTADLRPRLPRLPGRPVIVQGGADRIVGPEQARFLSEHLPGSRLIMLSDAGHVPFITQAARFNEFLREVVGEGPGR